MTPAQHFSCEHDRLAATRICGQALDRVGGAPWSATVRAARPSLILSAGQMVLPLASGRLERVRWLSTWARLVAGFASADANRSQVIRPFAVGVLPLPPGVISR